MNAWWFQYFTSSLLVALFIGRITFTYYKNKAGGLGTIVETTSKLCFVLLFLGYEIIEVPMQSPQARAEFIMQYLL